MGVKKEKPGKARLLVLRCLPEAVLSGLSDGWGSLSTQEVEQRILWNRPGFGTAHSGPACQSDIPLPLRPRGRLTLLCPLGADAGYAGGTPRQPLHGTSQTHAQVTCGETVWPQLSNPKDEPGVRSHGSRGAGYHLGSPSHTAGPLCG